MTQNAEKLTEVPSKAALPKQGSQASPRRRGKSENLVKLGVMRLIFCGFLVVGAGAVLFHWFGMVPPEKTSGPPGPEWFSQQLPLYAKNWWIAQSHLLASLAFVVIAPLQFSKRFRQRHLRLHRILGRVFFGFFLVCACSGLALGLVMPYGENLERGVVVVMFLMVIGAMVQAVKAARARRVVEHRRWVIRLFAWSMAIVSMRIVLGTFHAIQPWSEREWFAISLGVALVINGIGAELWLRHSKPIP